MKKRNGKFFWEKRRFVRWHPVGGGRWGKEFFASEGGTPERKNQAAIRKKGGNLDEVQKKGGSDTRGGAGRGCI